MNVDRSFGLTDAYWVPSPEGWATNFFCGLLGFPDGLHFSEIAMVCGVGDADLNEGFSALTPSGVFALAFVVYRY